MLNRLRNNPWATALIVVALYGLCFIYPLVLNPGEVGKPAAPDATDVENLIGVWKLQIFLIVALLGLVALLGWWKEVGFQRWHKGTMKFALFPLAIVVLLFGGISVVMDMETHLVLGTESFRQFVALFVVAMMVGVTEETMFRGILQYGAAHRFKPLFGAIIAAIVFGVFHFVNLIGGQSMALTLPQVVHAGADGFMYGALRLITGSLYPVIVLHGVWDLLVSGMQAQAQAATGVPHSEADPGVGLVQFAPGLLYGTLMVWRWRARQSSGASRDSG